MPPQRGPRSAVPWIGGKRKEGGGKSLPEKNGMEVTGFNKIKWILGLGSRKGGGPRPAPMDLGQGENFIEIQ